MIYFIPYFTLKSLLFYYYFQYIGSLNYFSFPHVVISFQAIQTINIAKEWVDHGHFKLKDEEARQVSAVKNLVVVEKKIKDLGTKLTEADRERKSAEATLASAKKQAEDQRQHLRKVEEQLAITQETIDSQKKELEKKIEEVAQAKQAKYDVGVKEIENALKAQVIEVCRSYYLQVWTEALNLAGVDASLELKKTENISYALALRKVTQPAYKETSASKALPATQPSNTTTTTSEPTKETEAEHSNPPPVTIEVESSNPPPTTANNHPPPTDPQDITFPFTLLFFFKRFPMLCTLFILMKSLKRSFSLSCALLLLLLLF